MIFRIDDYARKVKWFVLYPQNRLITLVYLCTKKAANRRPLRYVERVLCLIFFKLRPSVVPDIWIIRTMF